MTRINPDAQIPDGVDLTAKQREIWEYTHGLGGRDKLRAKQIAETLGISVNGVYVTRRRVKQKIEQAGGVVPQSPKRVIRMTEARGLERAMQELRTQLDDYAEEEKAIRERLEVIERERPEIEQAFAQLAGISKAESEEKVPVAA